MEKHDLQQIISGTGETEHSNIIQTIASYLRKSQKAGGTTKAGQQSKDEEENRLKNFIEDQQLWWNFTIENNFI